MEKLLQNKKNIVYISFLILVLILVRVLENKLFYDPFLSFFKDDFQNKTLPEFDTVKLFFGLFFRYLINSVVTVAIIHLLFKEISIVKLTSFLLLGFFIILIAILLAVLNFSEQPDYLFVFYIRRFLIQPLFLILFVPAFYYQRKVQ